MEYKFVELMSCRFERSPQPAVQQQISFRYNAMKSRLALMQTRLQVRWLRGVIVALLSESFPPQEVSNVIKLKNPSLLLQLQKAPASVAKR
jgi:hypothetical protein